MRCHCVWAGLVAAALVAGGCGEAVIPPEWRYVEPTTLPAAAVVRVKARPWEILGAHIYVWKVDGKEIPTAGKRESILVTAGPHALTIRNEPWGRTSTYISVLDGDFPAGCTYRADRVSAIDEGIKVVNETTGTEQRAPQIWTETYDGDNWPYDFPDPPTAPPKHHR